MGVARQFTTKEAVEELCPGLNLVFSNPLE